LFFLFEASQKELKVKALHLYVALLIEASQKELKAVG